jgi:hypothetical protein
VSGAQYREALVSDIQADIPPTAPLLDAVEEIRARNERGRSSEELGEELSERALMAMAIYSAEVGAS